jgi:hypothetical protein
MKDTILNDLVVWTSVIEKRALEGVVARVSRALVPWASPASRSALASAVGEATLHGADEEAATLARLYDDVARASMLRVALAIELTQSTLFALARALGPDARVRLAGELPPAWAEMLEDPHDVPRDRRPAPMPDRNEARRLANARPGSSAPLSDAAPASGQADSIAISDDPHGDRKLSSTGG